MEKRAAQRSTKELVGMDFLSETGQDPPGYFPRWGNRPEESQPLAQCASSSSACELPAFPRTGHGTSWASLASTSQWEPVMTLPRD